MFLIESRSAKEDAMTPEQRLDRLERIAKLFVRAGLRERRNRSELNDKINIVIKYQMNNEERFARNEERFAQLAAALAQTNAQVTTLAMSQQELAKAQKQTDDHIKALIEIVARDHNGHRG
jgi:hypothetical protein